MRIIKMSMQTDYDVIIVGGRVAGANLAARLGTIGMRVLLLERQELPSLPAVSSPIMYASTMHMLDEIGAQESEYARNTPRLYHMATINSVLNAKLRIPTLHGRDYAYALDRARFDFEIYQAALRQPNVEGRMGYSVLDLVTDADGRVTGIIGKAKDGTPETITARVVIGADGRFSMVARKMNAQEFDRHEDNPTSIYYAYWRNVAPLDAEGASAAAYEADGTMGYLVMDSADGQTVVCMEGRSSVLDPASGETESFYLETLRRNPSLWTRLENAERVTTIRGMRHIGNVYRQAGGDGWALVGDAFHQKDPLDGQGIHDAVYMGKILALAMKRWWEGKLSWQEALMAYEEVVRVKTYPLYKTLQGRVQSSFYGSVALPIPSWVAGKMGQWIADDGRLNDMFGMVLTRQIPPDMMTLFTIPVALNAIARGGIKEVRQEVGKRLRVFGG
jgi:flavin-dependent dehydrogenase